MKHRLAKGVCVPFFAALVALGIAAGTAKSQIPLAPPPAPAPSVSPQEINGLKARIERLEKLNAKLLEKLEASQPANDVSVSKEEVKKLVEQAIAAQEQKPAPKAIDPIEEERSKWYRVDGTGLTAKHVYFKGARVIFESPNKDFSFAVTGRLHADAGWFSADPTLPDLNDATSIRRARIATQGTIWENMFYRFAWDWADANEGRPFVNFRDLYIRLKHLPVFGNVQIGQAKEQMSLSWSTTSNGLVFIERPLAVNAFIPDRNTGILFFRNLGEEDRVWIGAGLWRNLGNAEGFSRGDGQQAASGRITFLPYWGGERCWVHLGGSARYASYAGDQGPRFGDRGEARIGTPRLLDTRPLVGATNHATYGLESAAVFGPLLVQGELIGTSLTLPNGQDVNYWGSYIFASWFLTGESHRYLKSNGSLTYPVPYSQFFWHQGPNGWIFNRGAWEVACRYSYLDLRDGGFVIPVDAARAGGTGILQTFTLGVNWYLNRQTVLLFNYIHGWRDSDTLGADGDWDTFAMRLRIWF